ncbi:MAG: hypothetical protein K2W95_09670 [Candidatus Obscuribacterales bacterium]|nr:hypothetical protein [Candidatus Obscuribacterales bacterium]
MSLPGQPMDEGQMFQPPSQHISLKQQVIALSQSYPCPRCTPGVLEPFGHTETMACNSCKRSFVPLRGGRLLYPANRLGWKIAPTFWWDGYRWHWGGTTATTKQLSVIVMCSLMPVLGIICTATLQTAWWQGTLKCDTHQAGLISALVGLVSMQLIYFFCWDFEFYRNRK